MPSDATALLVTLLAVLAFPAILGLVSALLLLSGASATGAEASSDPPSVVEPRRYRGPYVPPAGHGAGPDPFAPGPDSPYWVPLKMTDPEGQKTFAPGLVEVASQLRYEHRDPALGLDLRIDLDMHPQPFMTVNEKIYPVKLDHSGWWFVAYVTADVGPREFENAWFAAFEDQTAVVSGFPPSSAVLGSSVEFRVEEVAFGVSQTTVVHDDGSTTSRAGYAGRLTLRETFGSFVAREWALARQQSFVLVYGALIGVVVALAFGWLRFRTGQRALTAPESSGTVPRPRPRRTRRRRKGRR